MMCIWENTVLSNLCLCMHRGGLLKENVLIWVSIFLGHIWSQLVRQLYVKGISPSFFHLIFFWEVEAYLLSPSITRNMASPEYVFSFLGINLPFWNGSRFMSLVVNREPAEKSGVKMKRHNVSPPPFTFVRWLTFSESWGRKIARIGPAVFQTHFQASLRRQSREQGKMREGWQWILRDGFPVMTPAKGWETKFHFLLVFPLGFDGIIHLQFVLEIMT